MTDLTTFDFDGAAVRTTEINDDPWFVGKDVCRALGLSNHSDALARLDEDERTDGVGITDPIGREQNPILISEPGVYRLIFTSRVPAAERFKRWLAHDVLPALRREGKYVMGDMTTREKLAVVREARVTGGKAMAARVWNEIGLPGAMEAEPQEDRIDRMVVTIRDLIDRAGPPGLTEKELARRKSCLPLSDMKAALERLPAGYRFLNTNEGKRATTGSPVKARWAWVWTGAEG
jgi:prophage antirepressor-like protein